MSKRVLIAEDDPSDVFLLKRAFALAQIPATLHFVRDGQEAIDYLEGEAAYNDRTAYPLPDLMLLDLKMPKLNGFDVLSWLRRRPGQKAIDYLEGEAAYNDRTAYPLPDLMLLDLKMPKLNGFDVLSWLRRRPG